MMYKSLGLVPRLFFLYYLSTPRALFVVYRDILLRMEKRNLIIIIFAIVVVLGIVLVVKYFDKFSTKTGVPIGNVSPEEKTFKNTSLPPPPATSTISSTVKLPKPLSPQEQQRATKKIALPPPPTQ